MVRKHPYAECEKCPFQNQGGYVPTLNTKPSSGIAVIGEAPGSYEAAYGIPFTGPSGDLLNKVLEHHGLNRSDVMITNVCSCRPEGNEDPPKAALAACAPRLHREIREAEVQTIISVGKTAAHALLDDKRAMRKIRVGPAKPYKFDSNIGVISTWHPAFSLRIPDSFPDLVHDFGKIKGDNRAWVKPEFWVFDDPSTAAGIIKELGNRFDRFVLDIECGADKDAEFVHPSEWPLLCLGFSFARKKAVVLGENAINSPEVRTALRDLLPRVSIIAHNGKFDLEGLRSLAGPQKLSFDTMLASYCINERPGYHSLDQLAIEILAAPDWKQEIKKYIPRGGNYANIPRPILYRYNAYDVVCTWELYEYFSAKMSEDERRKHDFLVRGANALIDVELAGITFDQEYNLELDERFQKELFDIENEINGVSGYPINPRSVPQVMRYYAEKGLILPTTGKDFLTALCEKIDGEVLEFTNKLLYHRKRAKLYGTYVKGLTNRVSHGKVYTTYLLHGTTSGRLSSRSPNLQNISREKYIRNQFTAEHENNVLVQCLAPGTKILKRDMTWVNIETLQPGDELVGFNKYIFADMEIATVENNNTIVKDCYEIITDRGNVICSDNHLWPVGVNGNSHREWMKTSDLVGKDITLTLFAEPWETDNTYEGGYLSGIIDGEATLNLCVNQDTRLSIAQSLGPVLNKTIDYLKLKGFTPSVYGPTGSGVFNIYVNGGKKAALKAIGMFRPARFLAKSDKVWIGNRKHTPVKIKEIRYLGKHEVVAVKTTTSTMIANGFLSHNCDYKQAEGRVIATLAQDEYLRGIFVDHNRDLFNELCNDIFGVDNWNKENRVAMKSIFYGNAYGRGVNSITQELNLQGSTITESEVRELMRNFNNLIPQVMAWQAMIKHKVLSGEDLSTPFGRHRSFWLITDKNKADVLNEALSFLPQSIASDICLRALINLQPKLHGLATIRLTIHDAIIIECTKNNVTKAAGLVREEMLKSALEWSDYVPFPVDISQGFRWGEL